MCSVYLWCPWICRPDVTFQHSLDVELSVSASDGGSCRTSRPWWILKFLPQWSRSDVARQSRQSQLEVLSWPRPSSSEEHLPYPWRGSHPPTLSLNTPKLAMWGTCWPLQPCLPVPQQLNIQICTSHLPSPLQYLLWGCMPLCMGG